MVSARIRFIGAKSLYTCWAFLETGHDLVKSDLPCSLQVDLDLGNYERFLDIKLTHDNNITTGKIYQVSFLMQISDIFQYVYKVVRQEDH